ncbi:phage integrase [Photobacterium arenosum]|uniref:phage integrase n=1 Tax=Photobacterium arenosum TaxID=2774143 RepID=UPI003AF45E5C
MRNRRLVLRPIANLLDLLIIWYSMYVVSLSNDKVINDKMNNMARTMGNPLATRFASIIYSNFRQLRMAGDINFVA